MVIPAPSDDVPPSLARLMGGLGRVLLTVGLLLLLFAGFQLWGTGLAEARVQEDLERRFVQRLEEKKPVLVVAADDRPAPVEPVAVVPIEVPISMPEPIPEPGEPIGVIEIPVIGLRKTIVEGTSRDVLRSGPGHYRSTPLPGRAGNTAIAGHRTTHGAPFFDIDRLEPGDEIRMETLDGPAIYLVEGHGPGNEVGHLIVDPSEVGVIANQGDDRLTLTACHPKYSAEQRIIVTATLLAEPNPSPIPEPAAPTDSEPRLASPIAQARSMPNEVDAHDQDGQSGVEYAADDAAIVAASLGWQPQFAPATTLWAGATAIIAMAAWLAGRLWRRFPAYAMAVPPTMLTLYNCFDNLEKFIPAV